MTKRLWVIAPHMDDEVLSFGGLIRRRVAEGWDVHVTFVHDRKYIPPDPVKTAAQIEHCLAAKEVLGYQTHEMLIFEEGEPYAVGYYKVLQELEGIFEEVNPDMVAIPGRNDLNQDHRHVYELSRILFRPGNRPAKRFTILESVAPDHMQPVDVNYGLLITDRMRETLAKAMACYEDEMRDGTHPRSLQNLEARYRYWGAQFGYEFAEPYRLVSEVD